MFQSVWSGPLESCGQETHTPLLQSIYNGGSAEKIIAFTAKALVIVILGFTLSFLLLAKNKTDAWQIALMFLIGGLLFHSIWEGKSQYTYPYVFTMIPYACYGIKTTVDKIESVLFKSTTPDATKQKGIKDNG